MIIKLLLDDFKELLHYLRVLVCVCLLLIRLKQVDTVTTHYCMFSTNLTTDEKHL